jgi:hypothetical protein
LLTCLLGLSRASEAGCLKEIPARVKSVKLIVLGELHGTREIPKFVGSLVCGVKADAARFVIAFEIPSDEGERVNKLVRSQASKNERQAFFGTALFGTAVQMMVDAVQRWLI